MIDSLDYIDGGTEGQLYLLIKGMVSRGHSVELCLLRETEFTRNLSEFPCPIYRLGIGSLLSVSTLRKLWYFRKSLLIRNIDVVHGFFNDVALTLPPLLMLTGIKSFTCRRDMGIWYSGARLFLLRLFRFTKTRLICNSLAAAKLTQEKEWRANDAIEVIYNGIVPSLPSSADEAFHWAPERTGVTSATINVVLVANIRAVKRIEDLIMAASILRDGEKKIDFYVIGRLEEESYCESLRVLLRRQRLERTFHFVGQVGEARSCLDRFDIGVLTSASEGFSNSIMEYLDAGLPVVVSKVGGNPELVSHGTNGYLYEVGNVDELAGCIRRLAYDAKLRQRMAANAKDGIRRFDACTMVERHEKLYMRP